MNGRNAKELLYEITGEELDFDYYRDDEPKKKPTNTQGKTMVHCDVCDRDIQQNALETHNKSKKHLGAVVNSRIRAQRETYEKTKKEEYRLKTTFLQEILSNKNIISKVSKKKKKRNTFKDINHNKIKTDFHTFKL